MPQPLSVRKRLIFSCVLLVSTYLVLEALASAIAWSSWWDRSVWLFEESGRTWHFDPVRGYRLTSTPSRFCRISNGKFEYVGTARGNSQGFPDRDDFGPKRSAPGVKRYAIFGDSFTEAQYLAHNWPDRAEDLSRDHGQPVELLNFAIAGGGLANWWSVLTKLVAAEDYELDGAIFCVYPGDLRRTFSVWEHRNAQHPLFGRTAGWDPDTFPTTLAEAKPFLHEHPALIVSAEEFERTLQGHWPRSAPQRFRPYLLTQVWRFVHPSPPSPLEEENAPVLRLSRDFARASLIRDMRQILAERRLPVMVVHIPDRDSLLDPTHAPTWPVREVVEFADRIGGIYLDATPVFAGKSAAEIRANFLPYDGHWSQAGSDRFAAYLMQHLDRLASAPPPRAVPAARRAGRPSRD